MKKGEAQTLDVPADWKAEEKKSNDRMIVTADIAMEQFQCVGWRNHRKKLIGNMGEGYHETYTGSGVEEQCL